MIIRTKIDRKVTIWESQEVWVEVENEKEFKEAKELNRLEAYVIDQGDAETLQETLVGADDCDCEFSEIIEIVEE